MPRGFTIGLEGEPRGDFPRIHPLVFGVPVFRGKDEEEVHVALPDSAVLIDVLGQAGYEGRLTWGEADSTLNQLDEAEAELPPLEVLDLPASAKDILARIRVPQERKESVLLAALYVALCKSSGKVPLEMGGPADWWEGASADEILVFDLYPGGPDGSDLASLERSTLEHRIAIWRGRDAVHQLRTRWLHQYGERLLAEIVHR